MFSRILFSGLEAAFNRFIQLDSNTAKELANLAGKCVVIDVCDSPLALQLVILSDNEHTQGRIELNRLSADEMACADCIVRGSAIGFGHWLCHMREKMVIADTGITVKGDLELGERIQHMLQAFAIDWEEHLSHIIGDIAAHAVVRRVRDMQIALRRDRVRQSVTEFIQEEAGLLPTRLELEDYCLDITKLRNDLDRIEARVQRLNTSLDNNRPVETDDHVE